MRHLKTITDKDLGMDTPAPEAYETRDTARTVVFDAEGTVASLNVALLYVAKKQYHKLPGGGVEQGETIAQAAEREAEEEIGCTITLVDEMGVVEEYRNGLTMHQTSYCYTAMLQGEKGIPQMTEEEIADGFEVVWLPLDGAIKLLESETGTVEDYEGKFINARELLYLKEAKRAIAE
ncbi:MAG: NUDIX domain-containing protein [Candidatus Spechtbacterales bacterium]